ncbi:MAG TPA: hypothetical protein VHX59_05630 [Mycobacteriales bacterium]|jgi:hypothetical protein|nr:hypothetical protein [Mycobacteriales bacterium]
MSILPLPVARLASIRDVPDRAPEADRCGALARGAMSWLAPAAGSVSCERIRGHEGSHVAPLPDRPRALRRRFCYRW